MWSSYYSRAALAFGVVRSFWVIRVVRSFRVVRVLGAFGVLGIHGLFACAFCTTVGTFTAERANCQEACSCHNENRFFESLHF
jgi:hypothetical protein